MIGIRSTERARLIALGTGALALNGIAVAQLLLARTLGNPLSVAIFSALIVGLLAQRLGIEETPLSRRGWGQVILASALLLPVCLLALFLSWSSRAQCALAGLDLSVALAVVESLALAYRDVLWLRILPAHAAETAKVKPFFLGIFVAACALAAASNHGSFTLAGGAVLVAFAWLTTALWLRTQNLWVPVAVQFVWFFCRDSLFSGLLFQLQRHDLPYGLKATTNGLFVALSVALLAAWVWWRTPRFLAPMHAMQPDGDTGSTGQD